MQKEFVRSMNSNYERILLESRPEERKYQYCMVTRGGIKGLLPCSLRYLNGSAYLYYDITSKQSITQLHGRKCIDRDWLKDFMWSYDRLQLELGRFLLDMQNVIWYPEQIFQDLENNVFLFLYVPYCEEETGFKKLLEYLVEKIDYEDELLVECVYKMYEQYEKNGSMYLQAQILEDVKILDTAAAVEKAPELLPRTVNQTEQPLQDKTGDKVEPAMAAAEKAERQGRNAVPEKKGFFSVLGGRKKKYEEEMESYRETMQRQMEGYAVAEDTQYEEAYGQTVYMEEKEPVQTTHRLYTPDGRILVQLDKPAYLIGKKKQEADIVLQDISVSRIHARISTEAGECYLEDLNSTNGTGKNGLRLQPYEKQRLEPGDEITIGKLVFIYR